MPPDAEVEMGSMARIEEALQQALVRSDVSQAPPRLLAAVRHAVFPGGARIRPQLCLAAASACGDDDPALATAAAAAIELLHCASLVHDDLPCFDDAPTRRGRPSVHAAFGERLAVLAGDALIVMAFQIVARAEARHPHRLTGVLQTVCRGVCMPSGIVAGQAWECEPAADLAHYQRAKTGALFAAAAEAGAQCAGAAGDPWRAFGDLLGEAYQVADDVRDVAEEAERLGKPVGRDRALGRPSMVAALGLEGAVHHFDRLVQRVIAAVPPGPGAPALRALVASEAERLVPQALCVDVVRVAA